MFTFLFLVHLSALTVVHRYDVCEQFVLLFISVSFFVLFFFVPVLLCHPWRLISCCYLSQSFLRSVINMVLLQCKLQISSKELLKILLTF